MTEDSQGAPDGWYNDPHQPGRMRYFDGDAWTDEFYTPGELPSVDSWIRRTFAVFAGHWRPVTGLVALVHFFGRVITWGGLWLVLRDQVVVDDQFVDFSTATAVGLGIVGVVAVLAQGLTWSTTSRIMHRAHAQANPSVTDALRFGGRALPRFLTTALMWFGITAGGLLVLLLVALVVGPFAIVVVPVVLVWWATKAAFAFNAVVIAPRDMSALGISASVSKGRFLPVALRVIIGHLVVVFAVFIVTATAGDLAQPIDPEALNLLSDLANPDVDVRDFTVAELIPGPSGIIAALVLGTIVRAAAGATTTSALVRLYLDSGAPAVELD